MSSSEKKAEDHRNRARRKWIKPHCAFNPHDQKWWCGFKERIGKGNTPKDAFYSLIGIN